MKRTHIVIHHTASKTWANVVTQGKHKVAPFHYGLELKGNRILIHKGPNILEPASATKHYNDSAIHIAAVGDFDKTTPPPSLLLALAVFTSDLAFIFGVPIDHIVGHSELPAASTSITCPGLTFNLDKFRDKVIAAFPRLSKNLTSIPL